MKSYDLVLIDSGYCGTNIDETDIYSYKNHQWVICNKDNDCIGHGTAVLSIIDSKYKGKFAVFKAFFSEKEDKLDIIYSALEYIRDNINTKILQLSFGIRAYHLKLDNICRELYQRKIIIVAAFDNYGSMSFPAAFSYVIGVDGNFYCKTKDDFIVFNNGIVDIQAKSGYQVLSTTTSGKYKIEPGNSFAASYVSLKLLEHGGSFFNKTDAMKVFYENYSMSCIEEKDSLVSEILSLSFSIFPLNKENYSLVYYSELLLGKLVDVYDSKYSNSLGRTITNFEQTHIYTIKNIDKCDWDSFNTLVIGHVRELSQLLNRNIKKELLEKCLIHKKNVYCYDLYDIDDYISRFNELGLKIICADEKKPVNYFGKLYQIKTPILAIMGTSKKQGKFTLQLQIKKLLEQKEINLGFLGTEPTAQLLGSDEVLPIGYDSSYSIMSSIDMITTLNYKMHLIDIKNKDLILVGGQSGFYPKTKINVKYININYFPFIYGTLPDGVILCVNYIDSVEYIKNSINAINSLIGDKVFLLSLYTYKNETENVIQSKKERLSDEEIEEFILRVKEEIHLPVIVSGNSNYNDVLFESIISYYCEPETEEEVKV